MRIHILGICGTFMGGLARLCQAAGHVVSGSDQSVYPPMSDQLIDAGIVLHEGYDPEVLDASIDLVVIGNALSRGNPMVEAVLNRRMRFVSGPELLGQLTADRSVLAVAGTHGKTTTTSLLAWILEVCGRAPGFLIGGVPKNFGVSARLGAGELFVVEADEYDTAFFDKRSKFVHYHPDVFGINNLEFDHADIFPDLAAIETQFHHAIRRIPGRGQVVARRGVASIERVLARGLWSSHIEVGAGSQYAFTATAGTLADTGHGRTTSWALTGSHNAENAELAVAMAVAAGVDRAEAFAAVASFDGVARRLNCLYQSERLTVWDDFAHHPTAIARTLEALRGEAPERPLTAVIELASNTMKQGVHAATLLTAAQAADRIIWVVPPSVTWSLDGLLRDDGSTVVVHDALSLVPRLSTEVQGTLVLMSNGGFSGLQGHLAGELQAH